MATMKYFSDHNGETVELVAISNLRNAEFDTLFPGVKGKRCDSFSKWVGYAVGSRDPLPLTRRISYKSNPSLHKCDARCMHAKGRTMDCQCSCGGANHGKGG